MQHLQHRLIRMGKLYNPHAKDENQCVVMGHGHYQYRLEICTERKLDKNGWIIDHALLDEHMQDMAAEPTMGSCEEFSQRCLEELHDMLVNDYKIPVVGIKLILQSQIPERQDIAYLETEWVRPNMPLSHGLNDIITFGFKHRGRTIKTVLKQDPQYLIWCIANVGGFKLNKGVVRQLEEDSFV
jgi:hypothetical protein